MPLRPSTIDCGEAATPEPIYICGPTASGKSALAIEVAHQHNGEIVNADAFQLFRGIETITAAPSPEDQSLIPHHLYSLLPATATIDAGSYIRLAAPVIAAIQQRGKTPIITGGSGLYLKFLTHGPAPLPSGDPGLRARMDEQSLESLIDELRQRDPVEAARTDLKNRRFVSRALEICLLTGSKASELRDRWESKTREVTSDLRGIIIQRERSELHARIAQRTRIMLDSGAIDEVANVGGVSPNCEKAIGFREIRAMLAGVIDRAICEEKITTATRQYAKRQETWFRRETWLKPWRPSDKHPPVI